MAAETIPNSEILRGQCPSGDVHVAVPYVMEGNNLVPRMTSKVAHLLDGLRRLNPDRGVRLLNIFAIGDTNFGAGDIIAAAGGDGTLHAVINGVAERDGVTVLATQCGTTNEAAKNLGACGLYRSNLCVERLRHTQIVPTALEFEDAQSLPAAYLRRGANDHDRHIVLSTYVTIFGTPALASHIFDSEQFRGAAGNGISLVRRWREIKVALALMRSPQPMQIEGGQEDPASDGPRTVSAVIAMGAQRAARYLTSPADITKPVTAVTEQGPRTRDVALHTARMALGASPWHPYRVIQRSDSVAYHFSECALTPWSVDGQPYVMQGGTVSINPSGPVIPTLVPNHY